MEGSNLQQQISSLPDKLWDVLIVGAGPAGSTAAIHLASEGHSVLLTDKERFPREKVCGDGLINDALRCLQRVGLLETVQNMAYHISAGSLFSPSHVELNVPGTCLTLRRYHLDSLLASKAVSSGATFIHGAIDQIQVEPDGSVYCTLSGTKNKCRTRICIIGTGSDLKLMQKLGMVYRKNASAVAMRCYVRSSFTLDRLVVSYHKATLPSYAWIFPMGDNYYNIGCSILYRENAKSKFSLKRVFSSFIKGFPIARELMECCTEQTPLRGARVRCGLNGTHPLYGRYVLAIGESIGTTLPLTGEGIGKSMESAEMAADVIDEALKSDNLEKLSNFPLRLEQELRPRYLGYKVAEKWLSKPWLNELVIRRASESLFIRKSLRDIAAERTYPQAIFSMRGITKSFWK